MSDEGKAVSLNDWLWAVGPRLPEWWELAVRVRSDGATVELVDPSGEIIEVDEGGADEGGIDLIIERAIAKARELPAGGGA